MSSSDYLFGPMRENTWVASCSSRAGDYSVRNPLFALIHRSLWIWMFGSLPTFHIPSLLMISQPTRRLDHPHDARLSFVADRNSPLENYKPFKTRAQSASDSSNTRATIFVSRDMLKLCNSRKPSHPASFELVKVFHLFGCTFLPVYDWSRQQSSTIEFISDHHVLGKQNILMA